MMLPSNYDYIDSLIERYESLKLKCNESHEYINNLSDEVIKYVFKNSRYGLIYEHKEMITSLRRTHWHEVFNRSNLSDIISSTEKKNIYKSLDAEELPDFSRDNIESTVKGWIENSYRLFSEKVNSVFERLSGDHVTNQPHGFTKRIIYKNLISYSWFPSRFNMYTFSDYGINVIHDLRTSIQVLYKLPISSRHDTELILKTINERNEFTSFDHGAFQVKVFKNGNAHIELHPHVAIMLNCELSKLFPNAIPSKHKTVTKEIKEYTFSYQHLSEQVKTKLREFIMYSTIGREHGLTGKYQVIFKKSQWIERYVKEVLDFLDIKEIENGLLYECDFDPVEIIRHVIVNGMVDYKSNQFYPTPKNIVDDIVLYVGDVTDKLMLEPSAGRGSISSRFKDFNIHCIDKEELNTVYLKQLHKKVVCNDFLFYEVKKESDKYDIIVMNPPYNKKQWKTHVDHALSILKKDGVVYAVLPSGKESYFENCEVLETYTDEFENTTITTCLYKIGV